MTDTTKTVSGFSGVVAPVLFVVVFTIFGFFHKDYSAVSMFVSALSLGSSGWIQIANFMVFGLLSSLFATRVAAMFSGKASMAGPIFLSLSALCFFLSGPFVMDPMGTAQTATSSHGTVHGVLGAVAFLLMPTACFVFYGSFSKDKSWHFFKGWTLAAAIVTSCTVVFFSVVSKDPSYIPVFSPWFGLIQRSVIVPYMAWLFAFAAVAYWKVPRRR